MPPLLSRRSFLAAAPGVLLARDAFASVTRRSLTGWLVARVDEKARQWDERREAITTAAAQEARNQEVRRLVRDMLGPMPPASAVRVERTGTLERDGYRVEKLLLESLPDLWGPANLYVPVGAGPFPAVLSPCGHYEVSRMHPDYQLAYIGLALAGFVVLAYDPPGQGERRHYWNRALNANEEGLRSVDEHSMAGHLLLLLGESLTGYMVRDGMRGIDYLLTRPDVDPRRIVCAGHSGGGTLTMFLACADERIACAVINEGGTAHHWPVTLLKNGAPPVPDAEQNLFPAAIYGVDTCDMHAAVAPRPLLALIENYSEPFDHTAAHVRARYELLNAAGRFETAEAQARHAWTPKLRLATTDFCSRWLLGKPGPAAEAGRQPEQHSDLYVTPEGSLRDAGKGTTLFSRIARQAADIDGLRPMPRTRQELSAFRNDLRRRLPGLLRIELPDARPDTRVLSSRKQRELLIDTCEIDLGAGMVLEVMAYRPNRRRAQPVVLVSALGRSEAEPSAELLAAAGHPVLCVNPRGIAWEQPAAPPQKPYAHLFSETTGQAYLAWSLDEELFGMRVLDILSSAAAAPALLHAKGPLALCAFGDAAPWALCAALLESRFHSVVCHEGLVSWRALLDADRYAHGAGVFVRGIFSHCDLPQIAGALAPRRLILSSPSGAMRTLASSPSALAWTTAAYACSGASGRLLVVSNPTDEPLPARLLRWLR